MYGGVSLAVYENGVAQELFRATKGEGIYGLIGDLADSDIVVDVVSGTSAGGINGILLAYALANGKDFRIAADLWRNNADILALLRSPKDKTHTSIMDSAGYYQDALENAFRKMDALPYGNPSESEIDLFITGTNVHGRRFTEFDDQGHPIDVKDHRAVFLLSYREGRKNEFASENISALSRLARITSCFPVAFEPVYVAGPESEDAVSEKLRRWGKLRKEAYFMDGGVLDNKPFSYTINAIFSRVADRDVSRMLFYVEPDPEQFAQEHKIDMPTVLEAARDAVIGIPGYESIASDLQSIVARNNKLTQYQELANSLQIAPSTVDFIDDENPQDIECLEGHDSYRIRMYVHSRMAQLRERALLGILRENGELPLLEGARRHAAKVLVDSFTKLTAGDGAWATLQQFDVYYRLRRLFHVVYKIPPMFHASSNVAANDQAGYARIWRALNHQIKMLEMVRFALEEVVDNSAIGADDSKDQEADARYAVAKWTAVRNILSVVLEMSPLVKPPVDDEAENQKNRLAFMEDRQAGLRKRIASLRGNRGDEVPKVEGNIFLQLETQERAILRQLPKGDTLRLAYCNFIVIDSYLFAMEHTAEIEAKDIIRTVRISPIDAQRGFSKGRTEQKLCGNELAHFGGFLKRSWRANDIMIGRLDALCQLIECIVTPERILDVFKLGSRVKARHPDLEKALHELHDARQPAPEDLVFVSRYNRPWKSWRTAFDNACKRSGIRNFRFHDLRHCYGSWLARNGTDIKARMELMRHKTPAMTMRYSHLSVDYKRQAIAGLPSFTGEMESEKKSQRISQQPEEQKVVAFAK
jgi:patatin-related protein